MLFGCANYLSLDGTSCYVSYWLLLKQRSALFIADLKIFQTLVEKVLFSMIF